MIKTILLILAFIALTLITACSGEKKDSAKNQAPKKSELATLMRVMEAHGDQVRIALRDSLPLPERPSGLEELLTAKPTPKMNIHEASYPSFVNQYLTSLDELYMATAENRKTLFNDLIQSCSNCHQLNCPGPLVKIDKMYIK